eukprot:8392360-Ditylum_brightwellii.AAC.1
MREKKAQSNGGLGSKNYSSAYDDTESSFKHPVSSQESNQVRAANFLQLANGNYVLRNSTFKLSPNWNKHKYNGEILQDDIRVRE